ncbi:helix-turn-helix transcriptional regulator [Streptomyces sp. DSM 44917]|uniref:Helix-turn-helix transcriptional regulator n=1 Tax=Streptomyces boetiae TaxID=3075541 RepID=A0ABU2L9C0_9ACTN|nr:helix-turn-helix transcriptional regulator [Streptomyces sp. DSM 44917]MDT0308097.1 helix-turn-helix transcriptional regulator [Streptomyces sp. DSM 44917]
MGIDQRDELRAFLRSRRARLSPADVGLPARGGRRRVPGLRREELALLAGVSVAYYTRLEQGHGANVSAGVLEAIATALRLNPAERDHLTHLVRPAEAVPPRHRAAAAPPRVRPELRQLLDQLTHVPAFVSDSGLDVLAWNRPAALLLGDFAVLPPEDRNLARMVFLDPAQRELYVDWEAKAADLVAVLRRESARRPDDPRLCALLAHLKEHSAAFRDLWARHDVRDRAYGTKRFHHPTAGPLTLRYETLTLPQDPAQQLVTFHADPGTPSESALHDLLSAEAVPVPARR